MKSGRHDKIMELIDHFEIETQEELIRFLQREGYNVTQATVSRDINELKLSKIPTGHGTYKYTMPKPKSKPKPDPEKPEASLNFNNAIIESIKKVDFSGNMLVVSTYPGLANAVAAGLDAIESDDILGSVAGDDTIFIVTRGPEASKELVERIMSLMKVN